MAALPQLVFPSTDGVLATVGGVILLGSLAEIAFIRYGLPESVGLMLLGMFMGPVLHIVPSSDISIFEELAPVFGSVALIVIVFGGGIRLDLKSLRGAGKAGSALAVLDTALTMAFVTPFAYLVLHWPLAISALFGALLGETTAAIVIPVSQGLKLDRTAVDILTFNSTINSITCILAFYLVLETILHPGLSGTYVDALLYASRLLGLGLLIGIIAGVGWVFLLDKARRVSFYRATLGLVFVIYAFTDAVGSSAVLAVLVFSIIVGNYWVYLTEHEYEFPGGPAELGEQLTGVAFLDKEITFIVKVFFYVFIGLLVQLTLYSALMGLAVSFLLLIPRGAGVLLVSRGNEQISDHIGVFLSMYPRGLTVSVLAGILLNSLVSPPLEVYAEHIFSLAFMVILFTTIISGVAVSTQRRAYPSVSSFVP
ncbi:MAG: cation:proton antiporter [Candidatus Marsarchaeota archaeon]|nr:cation:proton antiporter [Candidatus Marsarchaeota archaeon]